MSASLPSLGPLNFPPDVMLGLVLASKNRLLPNDLRPEMEALRDIVLPQKALRMPGLRDDQKYRILVEALRDTNPVITRIEDSLRDVGMTEEFEAEEDPVKKQELLDKVILRMNSWGDTWNERLSTGPEKTQLIAQAIDMEKFEEIRARLKIKPVIQKSLPPDKRLSNLCIEDSTEMHKILDDDAAEPVALAILSLGKVSGNIVDTEQFSWADKKSRIIRITLLGSNSADNLAGYIDEHLAAGYCRAVDNDLYVNIEKLQADPTIFPRVRGYVERIKAAASQLPSRA